MVEDYHNNYGSGWISLFRSVKKHWIWSDASKLKWWITILFEVNHSEGKLALGYSVHNIKRGQSAKSLRTWANEFETSVKTVVKFFTMLENDGMITRKTIGKGKQSTTLLTVCEYDTYQSKQPKKETLGYTQEPRKGTHKGGTNNNANNENNDNNDGLDFSEEDLEIPVVTDFDLFWMAYDKSIALLPCQREWSEIDPKEYPKILIHVPKFVAASGNFLCNPLKYLKDRRWLDKDLPNYANQKPKSVLFKPNLHPDQ